MLLEADGAIVSVWPGIRKMAPPAMWKSRDATSP